MPMHLTVGDNHNETTETEEIKQETSMNSRMKLPIANSEGKKTKKSRKRELLKIDCEKIRPANGKRKLQSLSTSLPYEYGKMITRKVKERLLNMPKKERKMYIRKLRRKHKSNFDLVLKCKHLWEKLLKSTFVVEKPMKLNGKSWPLKFWYSERKGKRINFRTRYMPNCGMRSNKWRESATQRKTIFDAFRGHCVSLLRISSAAQVLELAYNDYANAQQRHSITIEFYGSSDSKIRTLKEIIADCPSRKSSVVKYLENILIDVVDKPQIKLSLTHRLLSDFFEFADSKQLQEMIDSLKLCIPQIIHTNDGVRTAMKCLWNSSAKSRKVMLRNFKGLVARTCLEEFAHRFLIAVFDTLDDTVLIDKYLLKELLNNIGEIVKSTYGIKVMHHLIHPRDPRFCSASQIAIYKAGDGNPYSKKDPKLRYAELFSYIQKPFCNYFAANMNALLFENHASLLVLDILEAPMNMEDRAACYDAIASICDREFIPCDGEQLHPVEHPQAHFVISKLLKSDSKFDIKLGDFIVKRCKNQLLSWLSCNKGCFILLHILENASQHIRELVRNTLCLAAVERYHTKGATILMQKLK
ncbi:Pumilio domain-containing protein 12 [Dirofilaria immitis]|nr:Pumilio domain-containing protein 12 [Dirofilaria immitis]